MKDGFRMSFTSEEIGKIGDWEMHGELQDLEVTAEGGLVNVAEMPEMTLRYEWEGKKYIAHLAIMRIEEDPC